MREISAKTAEATSDESVSDVSAALSWDRRSMIRVTPQMRILAAVEPADFRKGIDGPARARREGRSR